MASAEEKLIEMLRARDLVRGDRSRWGMPLIRHVGAGHEPQRTADATALQKRLVACAYGTPAPGADLCASWVEQAFSRLGLGVVLGSARELCDSYCARTDTADLKVGMIVATTAHPYSAAGLAHGHVGLYVGDDKVRDCVAEGVRTVPLELWLSAYGVMADPRWGWLGGIGLG